MSDLRHISQLRTDKLFVSRQKWSFPYYELTDGQFVYARLRYKNKLVSYAEIETADNIWTIERKGIFSLVWNINQGEDQTVGTVTPAGWKGKLMLQLDKGFEGKFYRKSLFSRSLVFGNDTLGDMFKISPRNFSFKKPFEVNITHDILKISSQVPVILAVMIGINVILIRQAHAAAAAS